MTPRTEFQVWPTKSVRVHVRASRDIVVGLLGLAEAAARRGVHWETLGSGPQEGSTTHAWVSFYCDESELVGVRMFLAERGVQ